MFIHVNNNQKIIALKNYFAFLIVLLGVPLTSYSQDESFETTVPSYWSTTNGTLSTSTDHYKHGNQSLKWDWSANAVITISNLQSHGLTTSEVLGYYFHFFRMWVYNNAAIPGGQLQIEFYDNSNKQFYYSFGVNYTGWRAATADYDAEMSTTSTSPSTNITTIKIKAPTTGSGTFFFDFIDFTFDRIEDRAKDYQLPFITNSTGDLHWMEMMKYQALPKTIAATTPTTTELSDLAAVKLQYDTMIKGSAPNATALTTATNQYTTANISYTNGIVKGQPLFGKDNPDTENLQVVENFILVFARDYKYTSSATSKDYFLNSVRYLLDQGYADGSLMETLHHVGYSFRNIPYSIHLMQAELTAAGLWDQAQKMVEWYSAVDGIWSPNASNSNMDDGNTRTVIRLGACLYKTTDTEKVQYLKGFKQYIENFLTLYSEEGEGMKVDFTGFHHNINYPGYSFPSFNSLAQAIGYIAQGQGTFAINTTARTILKKSILLARVVSEGGHIPNSLSGRNPFVNPSFKNALTNLGLTNPPDADLLKASNYVYGTNYSYGTETPPTGFWQVNFTNLGTYRQSDWVADIKGFNKYFYGTEIYSSNNRFGRYQSYGAVEILYPGGHTNSGLDIDGWDWNKTPGATTKHLSDANLEAAVARQDETTLSNFAASLRFGTKGTYYIDQKIEGNYGVFGMDFTQAALSSTHDTSFKFKKSVFCFDGKLICLGSNIKSANGLIATNLFQNSLASTTISINVDNAAVTTFPYSNTSLSNASNHWMIDAVGTGYFIKSGNSIVIDRKSQTSANQNGGVTTTTGNFASAYISHGTAPTSGNYEYVIIPKTTPTNMVTFSNTMANSGTAFYQVIQKDATAHIVKYNTMYGYSLFVAGTYGTTTPIQSNNVPCLIMTNQTGNLLALSVVNPDLNFAANYGPSQATSIILTVNGKWNVNTSSGGSVSATVGTSTTTLTIAAKDGLPVDIVLTPTTTTWNGSAWSNGIPYTTTDAIIAGNYSENTAIAANNLTVNSNAIVSIPSGNNVTLAGALTVSSGSFTLENNAKLIQTSDVANTGAITVKRNSAPMVRLDYTLWSSPVAAQNLFSFSPTTVTTRFYNYVTSSNNYSNTGFTSASTFTNGKGYAVRAPNNYTSTPTIYTGQFTGVPNNGPISIPLVATSPGFNLVGNPYPSPIDATAFVTANTSLIDGTLYLFSHNAKSNGTTYETSSGGSGIQYATWNSTGATAAALGVSGIGQNTNTPNGTIQVGQGFIVKATTAGNLSFTNSMRTVTGTAANADQFFKVVNTKSATTLEKHRLWLDLTNANGEGLSQLLVGYVDGATNEVDNLYDGEEFGTPSTSLTSLLNDKNYTIQGRALPFTDADTVPLAFKAATDGTYTIALAKTDGIFATDQEVLLKDNATGTLTNLKTGGYTFTATAGTANSRFELAYATSASNTIGLEAAITAVKKQGVFQVSTNGAILKDIAVYDLQGRLLMKQQNINSTTSSLTGLPPTRGVLILKVTTDANQTQTIKIIN